MKINAYNDAYARAWARFGPTRVGIAIGHLHATATIEEATEFAEQLLAAIEEARNG